MYMLSVTIVRAFTAFALHRRATDLLAVSSLHGCWDQPRRVHMCPGRCGIVVGTRVRGRSRDARALVSFVRKPPHLVNGDVKPPHFGSPDHGLRVPPYITDSQRGEGR